MDTLCTVSSGSYTTVIYSPVYVHWLSMYSCYMDHGLYSCSWIFLYSRYSEYCLCHMDYCYMSSPSCIPVTWLFPVMILIFPLLDMWVVDMRCVELSATWIQATGATSRIPHLLFPVILFRTINRAHVLVSCYMYHVLFLFLIPCVY